MSPTFMAWKVNRCSWAHKPHSTCSFDDRYWSDFYCTCPQIRTTRFKIHMFFSFCNATQIRIAFSCAEKCSTPSQYYINHCPNMSKVVVKYPKIWIQSQKKEAKPCSCFSLRLLDCLPQFLWLLHLVCGPDEKPRCLLLFLPWMFSCASLFWNGSFGRRESLINLSAVTPQTNPKYIYIYIYIYCGVFFVLSRILFVEAEFEMWVYYQSWRLPYFENSCEQVEGFQRCVWLCEVCMNYVDALVTVAAIVPWQIAFKRSVPVESFNKINDFGFWFTSFTARGTESDTLKSELVLLQCPDQIDS